MVDASHLGYECDIEILSSSAVFEMQKTIVLGRMVCCLIIYAVPLRLIKGAA